MPSPEALDPALRSDPLRSPSRSRPPSGGGTVVRLVVPGRGGDPGGDPAADEGGPAREIPGRHGPPGSSSRDGRAAGAAEPQGPSDEVLVKAVQDGERWAAAALLDRYSSMVERLVRRVLGHDQELEDLVQEALATVLTSIHQVRDGAAVKGWIAQVAVHTAHRAIRKRKLYRWLLFWYPQAEEPVESPVGPREALRRVYAVLEELPADERVPFALRFLDEMPLEEVAAACGVSLATVKRRLSRAEKKFLAMARRDAALAARIEEGDRWTSE